MTAYVKYQANHHQDSYQPQGRCGYLIDLGCDATCGKDPCRDPPCKDLGYLGKDSYQRHCPPLHRTCTNTSTESEPCECDKPKKPCNPLPHKKPCKPHGHCGSKKKDSKKVNKSKDKSESSDSAWLTLCK